MAIFTLFILNTILKTTTFHNFYQITSYKVHTMPTLFQTLSTDSNYSSITALCRYLQSAIEVRKTCQKIKVKHEVLITTAPPPPSK